MNSTHWIYEEKAWSRGFRLVAGIDEAGRGPLAGPVVASAVILSPGFDISGIDDSKKLTPKKRALLYDHIVTDSIALAIGIVDASQIDEINILQASLLAMDRAVARLPIRPDFLLIDGTFSISSDLPQEKLPKGDSLSASIAAASIVAKVMRDRLMDGFHEAYPQYGFLQHKGYPTRDHRAAIRTFGICPIHRKTFKGVKEFL